MGTCKRSISGRTFALNRVFYPQQKPAILLNANGCCSAGAQLGLLLHGRWLEPANFEQLQPKVFYLRYNAVQR